MANGKSLSNGYGAAGIIGQTVEQESKSTLGESASSDLSHQTLDRAAEGIWGNVDAVVGGQTKLP